MVFLCLSVGGAASCTLQWLSHLRPHQQRTHLYQHLLCIIVIIIIIIVIIFILVAVRWYLIVFLFAFP